MRWCNISIPWITLWPFFMCILNVILFRFGIEIVWDGARWVPHEPPSVLLLCPLSEWGEPPSALQLPSYPSISQQVCSFTLWWSNLYNLLAESNIWSTNCIFKFHWFCLCIIWHSWIWWLNNTPPPSSNTPSPQKF